MRNILFGSRRYNDGNQLVQIEEKDLKLVSDTPPVSDLELSRRMNLQYIEKLNEKIQKLERFILTSQKMLRDQHIIRSAHLAALDIIEKSNALETDNEIRPDN